MADSIHAVSGTAGVQPPSGENLQNLVKQIAAYRLDQLQTLLNEELELLKSRQQRIRFLHQLERALIAPGEEKSKGGADFEADPELKRLRQVGREMYKRGEELEQEAKQLGQELQELKREGGSEEKIAELEKRQKSLEEEASELKDTAEASGSMMLKHAYSKEEKERLIENIRTAVGDLSSLNQMQLQKTSRLNQERHETLLIGKMVAKTVNEILAHMARGIK